MPLRIPAACRIPFVLALVAAGAMLLASGAEAGFDLGTGGERISPPVAQVAKASEGKSGAKGPAPAAQPPCERNVEIAASKGLRIPDGWEFHCVGPGLDWEGGTHWGVTCPYAECPEGAGPYISVSNPTYYVVAHELCHANFGIDEQMADSCAAKHGASLATSPYS